MNLYYFFARLKGNLIDKKVKIDKLHGYLISLFAALFLYSGIASAKEDGVCRVTNLVSIVKAYTRSDNGHSSFLFRWFVGDNNHVYTNLAGEINSKYNQADSDDIDDKGIVKLFSGNHSTNGIFYDFAKTLDDAGNISSIQVHFTVLANKTRVWQSIGVMCEISTEKDTIYYPPDQKTKNYFLGLVGK